jgi:hypothetical protein
MIMKKILLVALAISLIAASVAVAGVVGSLHDLSTTANADTGQVCVFCHHPHRGAVAGLSNLILWNITDWSPTSFATYASVETSSTMNVSTAGDTVSNVGGSANFASYYCMACHDGTVSTNALVRQPRDAATTALTADLTLTGAAYLGTTLEDDHPVNFNVTQAQAEDPEIKDPFDNNGLGVAYDLFTNTIQCATCHDVHRGGLDGSCTDDGAGDTDSCDADIEFMQQTTAGSLICLDCHDK